MVRFPLPSIGVVLACLGLFFTRTDAAPGPDAITHLHDLDMAGRYAEAESLAAALLPQLEAMPQPDSLALAEASFVLADAQERRGRWSEDIFNAMERAFGIRSRHLPRDDFDLALTEMRYGEFLGRVDPQKSMPHIRRALEGFQSQPEPVDSLVADCWVDIGQLDGMLGQDREALEPLQKGLEIRSRILQPDDPDLAWAHINLGDVYFGLGWYEEARKEQTTALRILQHSLGPDNFQCGGPLSRLFIIEMTLGDLTRSIDLAQEGVRLAEANRDSANTVAGRINLASALIEFHDYEGARRVIAPALPLCAHYQFSDLWMKEAVRQAYGAACLSTGDTTLAMKLFREADAGLGEHPRPGGESMRALCIMGEVDVLMQEGNYAEALPVCERGTAMNDGASHPDRAARITSRARLIRIAEALGDTARIAGARADLERMLAEPRVVRPPSVPTAQYWVARADLDLGRPQAAWTGALAAENASRRYQRYSFRTLPDTRALEVLRIKSYILDQVLDLAGADSSRWETAWDRLVRNRAMVGAEMERRRVPRSLQSDPDVVQAHDAWIRAQTGLARRMVRTSAAPADSASRADLERLRQDVDRTQSAYAELLQSRGGDTTRVEVGLEDVLARLGPDRALVAFVDFENHEGTRMTSAFVARGDRRGMARIDFGPSAGLDSLIAPWQEELGRPPGRGTAAAAAEAACRRDGEAVRRAVWDRLAPVVAGVREVDLVGDGPVLDLPWQALPVGGEAYLVEQDPWICVLDAERDLVAPAPAANGGSMLAMGDPAFDENPPSSGESESSAYFPTAMRSAGDPCAAGLPQQFPPLPGTETEARSVARIWGRHATLLLGKAATEAAFKRRAPGSTVIHLATHGVVTGDACLDAPEGSRGVGGLATLTKTRPSAQARDSGTESPWMGLRTWLALAGAGHAAQAADDNDGILTALEVTTLDLRGTDWVVLSACHSGLSEAWTREGTLGMRRAFRLAGARSVIASQWAVDDVATGAWMQALYRARSGGETRASAAATAASRAILRERRGSGRSTHPFYWAGFETDGD